jgi:plasmid replication initiation protein
MHIMANRKALQVVPSDEDYVLQANQISRAAYSMPLMQRRLLHLIMAQVQIHDSKMAVVEMKVGDIVRALHLGEQGNRYDEVRLAAKALVGQVLDVDTDEGWQIYPWVTLAELVKSRDVVQFRLAEELLPYVRDVQDLYQTIAIADMTALQGKHSFRIFELVMANRGFAGRGGNQPGTWYVDLDFDTLRTLLRIRPEEYKQTNNLRKWVVDNPVREINEAGIGLRVECDYETLRRGRRLLGVRLKCKLLKKGDPRPVAAATKAEREEDNLAEAYPERYAELLKEAKAQKALPGIKLSPETDALRRLAAEVSKDKKTPRPKRATKAKS